MNKRQTLLLALTFLAVALMWSHLPLADQASYFSFADTRSLFFIPNAGDVLSNLPFLFVGLWGFFIHPLPAYKLAIRIIAFGILLTCFGSMYFHLTPNVETLFWDRLPMTIGFTGLVILLIVDRISLRTGNRLIFPLLTIAIASVVGWHFGYLSLRPYLIVQFGSLIFSLLTAMLTKSNIIKNKSIFLAIGFYTLAKAAETYDLLIFEKLNFLISGHTIKHLLAAIALSCIFYPLYKSKNTITSPAKHSSDNACMNTIDY